MKYIANLVNNPQAALALSKEEIEPEVLNADEVIPDEIESDDLDREFDDLGQTEDAVTTLESLVDLVTGLTTFTAESYTSAMQVVHGVMHTARLPVDAATLSTESDESTDVATRKQDFGDKVKSNASNIKNAVVTAIKRLFAMLTKFFNQAFDRIGRAGKEAQAVGAALGDDARFEVQTDLAKMLPQIGSLKTVSANIGRVAVDAVKQIKTSGVNDNYDKLRDVARISLPSGLIGNPSWDASSGRLNVEWAQKQDHKSTIGGAVMRKALDVIVEICADIVKQRDALKGSVLTQSESAVGGVLKDEAQTKQFNAALKLVNGIYKGWINYVGRVCVLTVGAAKSPVKPTAD